MKKILDDMGYKKICCRMRMITMLNKYEKII